MGFDKLSLYLGFILPNAMHSTKVRGEDWYMKLDKEGLSPNNFEIPNTSGEEFVFSIMHTGSNRELTTATNWLFECIEAKRDQYYPYQREGLTFLFHKADFDLFVSKSFSSSLVLFDEQFSKIPLVGTAVTPVYVTKKNMKDFISALDSHYRMHYNFEKPPSGRPTIASLAKPGQQQQQQQQQHQQQHQHHQQHHQHHHPQPAPAPYGGPTPTPYGGQPAPAPYGQPTPAPYGGQPAPAPYGGQPAPAPYGGQPAPYGQPAPAPYGGQPAPAPYGGHSAPSPYGSTPYGR
jgi:hypothetical protein